MAKLSMTQALRVLQASGISFQTHEYDYKERGGTAHSSAQLGVDEFIVIKTIVLEDENKKPLVALMHGSKEISLKALARLQGVKSIKICDPQIANKHSGYLVGGTSPFGLLKPLPIMMQESILQLPQIYINGGRRGLLVSLHPKDLMNILPVKLADFVAE